MDKLYLITGATGHVGTVLISELLDRGSCIRALVLPGEGDELPPGIEIVEGDITDEDSLTPFFDRMGHESLTLIHCAARITVASRPDPRVWRVNVDGTRNVMDMALRAGVERVVYISSVHAIPERPASDSIVETDSFSPDLVHGQYAKSKAAAAQLVLEYARKGLNVSIVHPSGIIGPGDTKRRNHMVRTLHAMAEGSIPLPLHGGYEHGAAGEEQEAPQNGGALWGREKARPCSGTADRAVSEEGATAHPLFRLHPPYQRMLLP